ncbi:MAG: hypothetical protein AAFV62_11125, partial [Pseudomonadota bacterium]
AIATGLPLDVWGTPYYAGWGLTTDHAPVPRRQRSLTREELIAITAFLYPRWLGPGNRLVDLATVIDDASELRLVD